MRKLILLPLLIAPLAGCMSDPLSRTGGGAVLGAVAADATGGNALTGAVIGGALAAATCGVNLGLPPCRPRY
ncbi:hypothetical protein [Gemmobacter nectariphilus]|uniref:hypothetical protein n=1 Tax=Gemmobacter nectariphilus TaxID=220343 RepID=UPI0004086039|nr:hypothetical protein [Gemmobacter nectariphilus]